MGSAVVPLAVLAGGAALVYVGITNPAGGAFAGIGNLIKGGAATPASPSGFGATAADLARLGTAGLNITGAIGAGIAQSDITGVRAEVIAQAQTWLGVPYEFGGNTRHGIDCSGFTLQVFATVGIHLPRVSYLQAKRGRRTLTPQPGDLVAFGSPVDHVGIYIGNGQMINAPHKGTVVRVEPVDYGVHPIIYRDLLSRRVVKSRPKKGRVQK